MLHSPIQSLRNFFQVYFLSSEISFPPWREGETNKTFIWKATDVFQKKQINRKMSAQGIIFAGHILSEKRNVFPCNIAVKCCENWQCTVVLFFKIVHWCALLKYSLTKRISTVCYPSEVFPFHCTQGCVCMRVVFFWIVQWASSPLPHG